MRTPGESEPQLVPQAESIDAGQSEQEKRAQEFLGVQLKYALKLHKQEIPNFRGEREPLDFEKAITNYTRLPRMIAMAYGKRTKQRDLSNNEEYKDIKQRILTNIQQEYNNNPESTEWMSKVDEHIANVINTLPEISSETPEPNNRVDRIGILRSHVQSGRELEEFAYSREELEQMGVSENDSVVEIHFPPLFELPEEKRNPKLNQFSIRKSFKELAKLIKEKYPEAKAIIGRSWILETKLWQKIGFHLLEKDDGKTHAAGYGFWGQFVDEKGNLKQDKIDQLLETGVSEYTVSAGYIPMDEFLGKHLKEKSK